MDLGSEISNKVKAAIKNKLQDLGSYVDDELPEYIMVMLGNKRSKEQMTEDLMLFLGENTLKFIDWLISLVEKLQDVSSLVDSPLKVLTNTITPVEQVAEKSTEQEGKSELNGKQNESKGRRKSPSRLASKDHSNKSKSNHGKSENKGSRSSSSTSKHGSSESRQSSKKRRLSGSDGEDTPVKTQVLTSVVKVQEKRPSLPHSKQATSSLLKRAVAEALVSVSNSVSSSLTYSMYDPTSPPLPIKVHSMEEKQKQKEMLLKQHRALQQQIHKKELEDTEEQENQHGGDSIVVKGASVEKPKLPGKTEPNTELTDEPLIELQVSEAEALEYSVESIKTGDTRIVAYADSQTVNDSEEEKQKHRKKRAVKSRERPKSPKFIVTLDGVGSELEDKYEKQKSNRHKKHKTETFDDYVEVDTSNMVPSQPPPLMAENQDYLPPAVEQVMFTVDTGSDDEEMQDMSMLNRSQERCKFWPDCANGAKCPFYHPTKPCRTFPNCKFADKCMFIHPLCKFDGRCTNTSCPFVHKSKNKPKTTVITPTPVVQIDESLPNIPQLTPCKFFPGCTRTNCQFLHPKQNTSKVCRYGSTCSRIDCKFTHPPSKAALKWISPSLHISERSFAVAEKNVTDMPVAS